MKKNERVNIWIRAHLYSYRYIKMHACLFWANLYGLLKIGNKPAERIVKKRNVHFIPCVTYVRYISVYVLVYMLVYEGIWMYINYIHMYDIYSIYSYRINFIRLNACLAYQYVKSIYLMTIVRSASHCSFEWITVAHIYLFFTYLCLESTCLFLKTIEAYLFVLLHIYVSGIERNIYCLSKKKVR